MKLISGFVKAYAIALATSGVLLLIAPELALSTPLRSDPQALLLVQLVSAALFGFGTANWTARGAILGGIYGRAVTLGNQAFSFVGALVLLKGIQSGLSPALWGLLVLLSLGAILYSMLAFRPPQSAFAGEDA